MTEKNTSWDKFLGIEIGRKIVTVQLIYQTGLTRKMILKARTTDVLVA